MIFFSGLKSPARHFEKIRLMNIISSRQQGFTLIELLVVIAIMGILLVMIVPSVSGIGKGYRVTAGAQALIDQLNRARQEALSRNRMVQVQFLRAPRNGTTNYSATRLVTLDSTNGTAQATTNRMVWLPDGVVIGTNGSMTSTGDLETVSSLSIPGGGTASALTFSFRPNGTTDLSANVHWTIVDENQASSSSPANFATIQLDSRTGRPRLFRP
jgi:uncharacterized protein (TIGR02596 family)